jgi:hypothetical protein
LPQSRKHKRISAAGHGKQVARPDCGGDSSTINKTMTEKTKTVQFTREKETKNTVKFAEVQTQGEAPVIGTLYLQKWWAGDSTNLKVTIEAK